MPINKVRYGDRYTEKKSYKKINGKYWKRKVWQSRD